MDQLSTIPTPHIEAKDNKNIEKVVLMPGDPLRAKYIAETFLTDVVQFNQVRGMLGFTGTYKGKRVSVMGSGMGMPSIGIYSYELYNFYGVETIIRVGSCGAMDPTLELMDIIIVKEAASESSFAKVGHGIDDKVLKGDQEIHDLMVEKVKELGHKFVDGKIISGDVFYSTRSKNMAREVEENGVIAGEMESFALFANAQVSGKKAACILTVSDSIVNHTAISAEARQLAFASMMEVALETAIALKE